MNKPIGRHQMTDADLLGYAPEELACNQCGGTFCGFRTGRVLNGKPLVMCTRKDEVKRVLSRFARH